MRHGDVVGWQCRQCNEELGVVRRNGSGVRLLELHDVSVAVVVRLDERGSASVKCRRCGAVRVWQALGEYRLRKAVV